MIPIIRARAKATMGKKLDINSITNEKAGLKDPPIHLSNVIITHRYRLLEKRSLYILGYHSKKH